MGSRTKWHKSQRRKDLRLDVKNRDFEMVLLTQKKATLSLALPVFTLEQNEHPPLERTSDKSVSSKERSVFTKKKKLKGAFHKNDEHMGELNLQ